MKSQAQTEPRQTVLYEAHKNLNARLIDFAGWEMPIQYSSITNEHLTTRAQVGLFDLSHMGRLEITGSEHREFLHYVLTNKVHDLPPGCARYSLVTNNQGGVLDDILFYAHEDKTFLVVNASNREKIIAHFNSESKNFDVRIEDLTFQLAMIAIQGPESVGLVNPLTSIEVDQIPYYGHAQAKLSGIPVHIARTGYTGEDGFEFFVENSQAQDLWNHLLDKGQSSGLAPVGLGARDTLRLEAGMPLYGHELDEQTNPLEAALNWAVKLKKEPHFIGQEVLIKTKNEGIKKTLVGLECHDKRIPRQGYEVIHDNDVVGTVTSGTASPTLNCNIAQAFVKPEFAQLDTKLSIRIRGRDFPSTIIKRPFYKRKN